MKRRAKVDRDGVPMKRIRDTLARIDVNVKSYGSDEEMLRLLNSLLGTAVSDLAAEATGLFFSITNTNSNRHPRLWRARIRGFDRAMDAMRAVVRNRVNDR